MARTKRGPDPLVDVAIEDESILERRHASRLIKPRDFKGKIIIRPLLTLDRRGAIYSEAVLDLIRSAKKNPLFRIRIAACYTICGRTAALSMSRWREVLQPDSTWFLNPKLRHRPAVASNG
jgi:hypothetical protein